MKKSILVFALSVVSFAMLAQQDSSVVIPAKVHHAEPLYTDLIRDLGARQGEKEWNVGWGIHNQKNLIAHTAFIEYEFAPINRLGIEVEVPVTFYRSLATEQDQSPARNRIEGIKLATQYTFLVSHKYQFSMAVAYLHEFRFHSFHTMHTKNSILKGNGFNPVLIVAKRLGKHFHTLLYTGPAWETNLHETGIHQTFQINTSIHYMLPTRHFIGVEFHDEFATNTHQLVARPQVKIVLADNIALGLVTGIPVYPESGMSFLARLIYEPRP